MASSDTTSTAPTITNITEAINQTLTLLSSKDDTSRFVGLALLKSLLDNQEELRQDPQVTSKCWEAVSARFLDRLLGSSASDNIQKNKNKENKKKKKSEEEIQNMLDLAVQVIHTFTLLNSSKAGDDEKLVGRTPGLIAILKSCSEKTATRVLQTLITFQSGVKGTQTLLNIQDLSPLYNSTTTQPLALTVLQHALSNAAVQPELQDLLKEKCNVVMYELLLRFQDPDAVTLLEVVPDLLPRFPPPDMIETPPAWLQPMTELLRLTFMTQPVARVRTASTLLASTLIQTYPQEFPLLLFRPNTTSKSSGNQPFSYLFPSLLTIDLRSTFPSLLEQLASPEYPAISRRLAADFNVLFAFLGFLTKSLDDPDFQLGLDPDQILKLRNQFAETSSLTIEFLRDRWDAAVSGTAGLHPDVRPAPGRPQSTNVPLSLTWDIKDGGLVNDPIILAAVRYLALWLREDENEALRREAAGIMDVLLGLYSSADDSNNQDPREVDFKSPVLMALEGILDGEDGVEAFLREDGWRVLSADLSTILVRLDDQPPSGKDLHIGLELVRVLFSLVESETAQAKIKEDWMEIIPVIASPSPVSWSKDTLRGPNVDVVAMRLKLQVSSYQLAAALLERAAPKVRKRYEKEARKIKNLATNDLERGMVTGGLAMPDSIEEQIQGAGEVINWLEELYR
ncbi:MAG: hypothetical protein M1823_002687 [Watsoniomyces obsoletus]|nr:MAG: hypothetical protein M1823_002687 [Watsoniomyces obsoletus]